MAALENPFEYKCVCVVVKIASRCNINCTYCYVYNKGDDTYKTQPKVMSDDVMKALFIKVKVHCLRHDIKDFSFVLHGGEPLLAGQGFFRKFVEGARNVLTPEVNPTFGIQTNGMLITDEWCDLFAELGITIGISLDGTKEVNDAFRVDHKGNGTYDRVIKGLKIAQKSPSLKKANIRPGLLSVINIHSDPVEVYNHFKQLGARSVSFLYPDNNYDDLPFGYENTERNFDSDATLYGDWLISIFDEWFYSEKEDKLKVSLFVSIIALLFGRDIQFELLGKGKVELLIIETDGAIEVADSLKICGNGFTKDGANIVKDELDDALQTDLGKMYHMGNEKLCKQCSNCPISDVCSGGFIVHRYKSSNGFNNPSIYCADLLKLITHIQNSVLNAFPENVREEMGVSPLSFAEAKDILRDNLKSSVNVSHADELEHFSNYS